MISGIHRIEYFLQISVDVVDSELNTGDFFRFFIWNFGFKFLFQRHNQLYSIEGVSAQIIDEGCLVGYFLFLDA